MRRFLDAVRDQFESWGIVPPRASMSTTAGPQIRVRGPVDGSTLAVIGTLTQENGEFVFRYDPKFADDPKAKPLAAFPDVREEYRSRDLWPFFAVRIPPAERSDVREALARKGLRPEQTLEVLGTLAKRSISNPYELELRGAS